MRVYLSKPVQAGAFVLYRWAKGLGPYFATLVYYERGDLVSLRTIARSLQVGVDGVGEHKDALVVLLAREDNVLRRHDKAVTAVFK